MPYISVVVAAYNAELTIERAIRSALSNDVEKEIIVVDDASTDNTAKIVRYLSSEHSAVKLVRLSENRGASGARNAALAAATGDWLAVLDADDYFDPCRLSSLLQVAHENESDLVVDSYFNQSRSGAFAVRFGNFCEMSKTRPLHACEVVRYGMGSLKPFFRSRLVRSNRIFYREDVRIGEDLIFLLRLVLNAKCPTFINDPKYYRLYTPGSLTKESRAHVHSEMMRTLDLLEREPDIKPFDEIISEIRSRREVLLDASAYWRMRKNPLKVSPNLTIRALRHVFFRGRRFPEASS